MITAKLVYNDGKDVIVNIPDADFAGMFASLAQGQVFWDATQKNGFWTSFENIRFIQFERREEQNESQQNNDSQGPCGSASCEVAGPGEAAIGYEDASSNA